jgi:hypothetical protein
MRELTCKNGERDKPGEAEERWPQIGLTVGVERCGGGGHGSEGLMPANSGRSALSLSFAAHE